MVTKERAEGESTCPACTWVSSVPAKRRAGMRGWADVWTDRQTEVHSDVDIPLTFRYWCCVLNTYGKNIIVWNTNSQREGVGRQVSLRWARPPHCGIYAGINPLSLPPYKDTARLHHLWTRKWDRQPWICWTLTVESRDSRTWGANATVCKLPVLYSNLQ